MELVQLIDRIRKLIDNHIEKIFLWTDSTIVLNWLSSQSSRWLPFVANRISIIQELSKNAKWLKIDSKQNPADIVSRGMLPKDLVKSSLWAYGPEFLKISEKLWPKQKIEVIFNDEMKIEERKTKFCFLTQIPKPFKDIISNCKYANNFLKLNRVFAFIFRWYHNFKTKMKSNKHLTVNKLRGGLYYIIFNIQNCEFFDEIHKLKNKEIVKACKLQKLNPFMDDSLNIMIMRVGGRLANSNLSFSKKFPIILPVHIYSFSRKVYAQYKFSCRS